MMRSIYLLQCLFYMFNKLHMGVQDFIKTIDHHLKVLVSVPLGIGSIPTFAIWATLTVVIDWKAQIIFVFL